MLPVSAQPWAVGLGWMSSVALIAWRKDLQQGTMEPAHWLFLIALMPHGSFVLEDKARQ